MVNHRIGVQEPATIGCSLGHLQVYELRLRTETLKIGRAGSIWKAQMGSDKSVTFLPFGRHFLGKDLIRLFWWLLLVKRRGVFVEMLVHFRSVVKGGD